MNARMGWRHATLAAMVLCGAWASVAAEGAEHAAGAASTPKRVTGVAWMRPLGPGMLAVGGAKLRYLAPGARSWTVVHGIPGDHMYRVAADDGESRLLASWEKDPSIHYFELATGRHLTLDKPTAPAGISHFWVHSLAFSADGRDALIFMTTPEKVTFGYRAAIDRTTAPTQLFRVDKSELLATGQFGAIYAVDRTPRGRCTTRYCSSTDIVAYEISSGGVNERILMQGDRTDVRSAQRIRSEDPAAVMFEITLREQTKRGLLQYGIADGRTEYRDLAPITFASAPGRVPPVVTRNSEQLVQLKTKETKLELDIEDLASPAATRTVVLEPRHNWVHPVHGFGHRRDGTIWIHWGDHLALVDGKGAKRGVDLRTYAGKFSEWAGVAIESNDGESLWIGVEVGGGRDWVSLRFADVDRRATPWPRTPPGCGGLPSVKELLRWPQQTEGCGHGREGGDQPRPAPPRVIKMLPDGSSIVDAGARGCIRRSNAPCYPTRCMPPTTLIATPFGERRLDELQVGMPVWTQDLDGNQVAATVLRTQVARVAPSHQMVHLVLSDGRTITASPGHPTPTGTGIEELVIGARYDGAQVVTVTRTPYDLGETRDLLPSGKTGVYWADGVPMGSTLWRPRTDSRRN